MKRFLLVASVVAVASCSEVRTDGSPRVLPLWALSASAVLEVGVVEGSDEYQFHRIGAARRLPSGDLLVADDGTLLLSRYSSEGVFLGRFGGDGEGPGEYKGLNGLYPTGDDSLIALDGWSRRASVIGPTGEFVRLETAQPLSGDSTFTMDQWLYKRYWVTGALYPEQREQVRGVLDGLPDSPLDFGYRRVMVATDGNLWIRDGGETDVATRWVILDPAGTAIGLMDIPERLSVLDVSQEEVIGRWRDPHDVEFLRVYALERSEDGGAVPAWLQSEARVPSQTATDTLDPESSLRQAFRALAIAQEMHYSAESTYTSDLDALEWDSPGGIHVAIDQADDRGWTGVFWHADWEFICGVGYGFTAPAGWPQGRVACAPQAYDMESS